MYAVCDSCIISSRTLLILLAKVLVMIFKSQLVRVIGLRLLRCSVLFSLFLEALLWIAVDLCSILLFHFHLGSIFHWQITSQITFFMLNLLWSAFMYCINTCLSDLLLYFCFSCDPESHTFHL